MINSCPVCDSADVESREMYRGSSALFKNLERAHCKSCDMVFASPMPDETELNEYNSSYFDSAHGGSSVDISVTAFFSAIARLRQAYVIRYLESRKILVENILEWGPGHGFFARNWLETNPSNKYFAYETDLSCHEDLIDAGVELVNDSLASTKELQVDLVVISHVLEHVPSPVDFLKNATSCLRQGGVLFVEVPCQDWMHKTLDEPHILFFDKASMNILMNKLGFKDIQISYHGQTINRLCSTSSLRNKWMMVRTKLISLGLYYPFASKKKGMEILTSPLERAAVAPYEAHVEKNEPAWWLRVVATKK